MPLYIWDFGTEITNLHPKDQFGPRKVTWGEKKKKSLNGFGSDTIFSFNHYSTDILSLTEPIHMHVTCLKPEAICTFDLL